MLAQPGHRRPDSVGPHGAAAQDRAIRADGATVILHPDGRWEIALAPPAAAAAAAARALTTANVFFGNLHSHTSYSDGSGTPTDAYLHARDVAGLDFLAITEHNHKNAPSDIATDHNLYNGSQDSSLISAAGRFNESGRFVALYGQEFSSIGSGNHANVLDVRDVIDEADVPNGQWDKLLGSWLPSHKDSEGLSAVMLLTIPPRQQPEREGVRHRRLPDRCPVARFARSARGADQHRERSFARRRCAGSAQRKRVPADT